MPAGTSPAGAGPAGHDPVVPPSPRLPVTTAEAALFDPATRDFPLDAFGRVQPVHPVEQAVNLALTLDEGSLGSAPTQGHRLRELSRGSAAAVATQANDFVRRALRVLLARGDVTLLSTRVRSPRRGVTIVEVSYRNNRLVSQTTGDDVLTARVKLNAS